MQDIMLSIAIIILILIIQSDIIKNVMKEELRDVYEKNRKISIMNNIKFKDLII